MMSSCFVSLEQLGTGVPGGDAALPDRLLHYFPDEVSSLGAPRFRLAIWDKLPVGSRLINLVPITSDSDASTSMLDPEWNVHAPRSSLLVTCVARSQLLCTASSIQCRGY
jgi:hypothetical protein